MILRPRCAERAKAKQIDVTQASPAPRAGAENLSEPSRSARPQTASGDRQEGPSGHGAKTAAVRERAIVALLSERTIERAAQRSGVGERTLRRWLVEDDAFKAEYEGARRATFNAAMSRIHALTARAVDTLHDPLGDKKHPSVRLGAARTVAEIGMHQHDAETIIRKLGEIETAQRQRDATFGRR